MTEKPVGYWVIGRAAIPGAFFRLAVYGKRPRWLTRIAMRLVFEIRYEGA